MRLKNTDYSFTVSEIQGFNNEQDGRRISEIDERKEDEDRNHHSDNE